MNLTLEQQIEAAHSEAERIEQDARAIEARIVRAGGVPLQRQYGRPIDAAAISKNLTLRSLIARNDHHLAAYLGVATGEHLRRQERSAARAAVAQRMAELTAAARAQNQQAQQHRERAALAGVSLVTGRRLGT